jgi:Gly-Xaa carboxypeptidase
MLKKYGEDSFALLVDEGSEYWHTYMDDLPFTVFVGMYGDIGGSIIAIPGIAEKGYVDVRVTVSTAGGHSSVPPPHTVSYSIFGWMCI